MLWSSLNNHRVTVPTDPTVRRRASDRPSCTQHRVLARSQPPRCDPAGQSPHNGPACTPPPLPAGLTAARVTPSYGTRFCYRPDKAVLAGPNRLSSCEHPRPGFSRPSTATDSSSTSASSRASPPKLRAACDRSHDHMLGPAAGGTTMVPIPSNVRERRSSALVTPDTTRYSGSSNTTTRPSSDDSHSVSAITAQISQREAQAPLSLTQEEIDPASIHRDLNDGFCLHDAPRGSVRGPCSEGQLQLCAPLSGVCEVVCRIDSWSSASFAYACGSRTSSSTGAVRCRLLPHCASNGPLQQAPSQQATALVIAGQQA